MTDQAVPILIVLIAKAYKMAHKAIPDDAWLLQLANTMANDLASIPENYLGKCYDYARLHYADVPTPRQVMKAWDKEFKKEGNRREPQELKQITTQPRPDEHWRDLVAVRIGRGAPDPTPWCKRLVAQEPTVQEVNAFCAMVRDSKLIDWWQNKAPYFLSADQIRYGLPHSDDNTSPIYQRERIAS